MVEPIKASLQDAINGYAEPFWNDPRHYSPMRSWSADDFRRWGWDPDFRESNFDHGADQYVLPFYREVGAAQPRVYKLPFHSEAAAHGWWRSNVPYSKYQQHRKVQERFGDVLG
jgi:hypothetical protein